jgi:hypothetical protein
LLRVKDNAYGHEWARCRPSKTLPMALNSPTAADQKRCPWLQMGPFCQSKMLLMALNGPIAAEKK